MQEKLNYDYIDDYSESKITKESLKPIVHFCKRAMERHGLILNQSDINDIVRQIKTQQASFIKWCTDESYRAFYLVNIFDQPYLVLFDLQLDSLVTIYHNSWIKRLTEENNGNRNFDVAT